MFDMRDGISTVRRVQPKNGKSSQRLELDPTYSYAAYLQSEGCIA